jgi:hypothetical protein
MNKFVLPITVLMLVAAVKIIDTYQNENPQRKETICHQVR